MQSFCPQSWSRRTLLLLSRYRRRVERHRYIIAAVLNVLTFVSLLIVVAGLWITFGSYHSTARYNGIDPMPQTVASFPVVLEDDGHKLYMFRGDAVNKDMHSADVRAFLSQRPHPILFVHGHNGDALHVRDLCGELMRQESNSSPIVCFAVEFANACCSAFHQAVINTQAEFTKMAVRAIEEVYRFHALSVPKVSLLAHSMGGCVVRNVIADENVCKSISEVMLSASPTNGHTFFVTPEMFQTAVFPTLDDRNPCNIDIISSANGARDRMVRMADSKSLSRWFPSRTMHNVYQDFSHDNHFFAKPYAAAMKRMYAQWPRIDKMCDALRSPFSSLEMNVYHEFASEPVPAKGTQIYDARTPFHLHKLTANTWFRVENAQFIAIWQKKYSRRRDVSYFPALDCEHLQVVVGTERIIPKKMDFPRPFCVYLLAVDRPPLATVYLRSVASVDGVVSQCTAQDTNWPFSTTLQGPCALISSVTPWTPMNFVAHNTVALILSYYDGDLSHVGVLGRTAKHTTLDAESDPRTVALRPVIPSVLSHTKGTSLTIVLNFHGMSVGRIYAEAALTAFIGTIVGDYAGALLALATSVFILRSNAAPWWTYVLSFALLYFHPVTSDASRVLPSAFGLCVLIALAAGIGRIMTGCVPSSNSASRCSTCDHANHVLWLPALLTPHVSVPVLVAMHMVCGLPRYLVLLMVLALSMHLPSVVYIVVAQPTAFIALDAVSTACITPCILVIINNKISTPHRYFDIVCGVLIPSVAFNKLHILGYFLQLSLLHHVVPYHRIYDRFWHPKKEYFPVDVEQR